jgi:hypothetical protein
MRFAGRAGVRSFVGVSSALLAAGCGGGGGGGSGISASFEAAATTLAEDAGPTSGRVVLHTSLPALTEPFTLEVVDLGTGTAASGSDYTAFTPLTIAFPAGSIDGDVQTIALEPLDDSLVEGANETVRLRLQDPSGGELASPATFTATLTDIHAATVGFAAGSSSTGNEQGGAEAVALELDCGAGVTLGLAVNVRVSDLRTGSATSSADYSAFSAQTVTFPSGSADGAVRTVNVNVIDDGSFESDETVELGLSAPTGCTVGAVNEHVLTIDDDDLLGSAAFVASEGPSGTESALAYDETLDLGSQTVGAGPNAGTLVRVTNGGGTNMALGAPHLTGSNANDFAVEVDGSTAPLVPAGGPAALDSASPLVALAGDPGPGIALAIDRERVAELAALDRVTLHDFPLPDLGPLTLELERRPLPVTEDAVLAVDGVAVEGGPLALVGDLQLWSGHVAELPGSRVFLALHGSGDGAQGYVELPLPQDRLVHFVADSTGTVRLLREPELERLGLAPPGDFCAGERFAPGIPAPLDLAAGAPDGGTSALTIASCRLAIETDYQLFQKFSSSAELTTYVTELVAAVSAQYFVDVQTNLSIAYLGVHTSSNDGWTTQESGGNSGDLLDEFQAAWADDLPVAADLAHFVSGASLGGGVAYVNVLCSPTFGFAVSGNITGTIDWDSWTGLAAGFTWDFVVVAHEIGHNFGSQHTHSYCPPLDRCTTNCTGTTACTRGTLMSYCHTCGGMANLDLYFHPVCANIMRANVNSSCLSDSTLAPADYVQYRVQFNPLTATGARSATLEFPHDAGNVAQPFRVQLTGTGN